jgi:hypothetical protein
MVVFGIERYPYIYVEVGLFYIYADDYGHK